MSASPRPRMSRPSRARVARERTAPAGEAAVSQATTIAGAIAYPVERRQGSTGWAIIGYGLLLILLYVMVADRRVVGAFGGLASSAQAAARAWIAPVDPIASLSGTLGHTAAAPSAGAQEPATSSAGPQASTSAPAAAAASTGPPAPSKIQRTPLRKLYRRYGTVSNKTFQAEIQRARRELRHA